MSRAMQPSKRGLLVTGAAGFIGANFAHYWLREHPEDRVVALDALTYAGNRESLAPLRGHAGFRFVHGDIRDEARVADLLREEALSVIVHFAAETHVDRSISAPDAFIDANVTGTHSLLKAARAVWLEEGLAAGKQSGKRAGEKACRFHHVSTDEVYGSLEPDDPPFTEESRYAPNSPYAASKAAADHLVRAYHSTYGLPATISHCSNNYGPYHFPEKLIPLCLTNCLRGRPLPVYGDGLHIRDWLHVEDHCRGIDRVLARGRPGARYNIGGGSERRNLELARALCAQLDRRFAERPQLAKDYPDAPAARGAPSASLIEFVEDRPGHDRRYALDASKINRELGFAPKHDFATGLDATIDWFLNNRAWWEPLLKD